MYSAHRRAVCLACFSAALRLAASLLACLCGMLSLLLLRLRPAPRLTCPPSRGVLRARLEPQVLEQGVAGAAHPGAAGAQVLMAHQVAVSQQQTLSGADVA